MVFFVEMGTRQYRLEGKTNTNFRKGLPLRKVKLHFEWEVAVYPLTVHPGPPNSVFWPEKYHHLIQFFEIKSGTMTGSP